MTLKTFPWSPGEYIKTPDDAIAYIEAALEEVGPEGIKAALRGVADSEGMSALARKTGLNRQGLYRALSDEGDPRLSTLNAILDALGLRLSVTRKSAA
ncbi:MAG: addiction module antidote protein [Hyphomonas sp.]|uniref:addiction module antidote protein n=1 Tax=Hyphomonas sp. TaxID=87 RepID=UPI0034A08263